MRTASSRRSISARDWISRRCCRLTNLSLSTTRDGKLDRLLKAADFEIRFRLDDGDLVMFDNRRLLHGRTSFDTQRRCAASAGLLYRQRRPAQPLPRADAAGRDRRMLAAE